MKKKLLGLGLGVAMSAAVVALPTAAFADSTCYTGCSQSQGGVTPQVVNTPAVAPVEPKQAASGGLPFTGADIEEMAAVGAGALLVGGALVRRSRRTSQAPA
jgi:hypothetical protein